MREGCVVCNVIVAVLVAKLYLHEKEDRSHMTHDGVNYITFDAIFYSWMMCDV